MDFLFFFLIVEGLCVSAWISRKCLVLDEDSPYPDFAYKKMTCPRSQLTANCMEVSNLALELSTVPTTIQVLCLWGSSGIQLCSNELRKFRHLQSLYIYGCLSAIDPDAFRGLTHLQLLSIDSSKQCNASLPSQVFSDLYNLEDLKLKNYELPQMTMCDLNGLRRMRRLDIKDSVNFTDLLCKVSCFSNTLESLNIETDNAGVLKPSNCSHYQCKFSALKDVRVSFRHIEKIENNAFICLKNITFLRMPMDYVLQSQILNSGIQQIDQMDLHITEIHMKYICEIVRLLSVKKLYLHVQSFQEYSDSSWENCATLEEISIHSKLLAADLSFMPTLKKLKTFRVTFSESGMGTIIEKGKSLDFLCKTNISLPSLQGFSYSTPENMTVNAKQFLCSSNLEHLRLEGKNLEVEESAFEGLIHLKDLSLDNSGYMTIESTAFKGLTGLRTFSAFGCLYSFNPDLFFGVENLEYLSLRLCSILTIQPFAFSNLPRLKNLQLKWGDVSEIKTNTFFGLQNLETLSISYENLTHLEASCFAHLPSLRVLNLQYLMFSSPGHSGMELLNLTSIFGGFPRHLSDLTLASRSRPMTLVIADDSSPEVGLSLSLSGQKIVLWGCDKPFFESVTKLHISTDVFGCAPNDTSPFYYLTSVVELCLTQWYTSTVHKLTALNRLVNLKHLDLKHVNFINLPDMGLMFKNLTKLEQLSLFRCQADALEVELIQDMTSLKYLYLGIVSTEVNISPGFFEHLTSLRFAFITKIQLRCTCDNTRFVWWAEQQQQAEVYFWPILDKPMQCFSGGVPQDIHQYGQAYCSLDVGFLMFTSTSCLVLLFMTTVLLHQMAREYLLAFCHIAHGWMNEALRSRNVGPRYQYDAFVSYSGRDERWVVESLLPNLEQRGAPFLRLCLHTRDFQLGKDIVENITDGLYRSRRTLCLVSRHFLRSNWCSLEMRLGTYRLQAEHRDVLILVFLEKIPSNLLSAHHRLARLVKTRTYMEWPQDPAQQQAFWDRLWKKLLEGRVQ
ncbi:toll-like receptor 13 [Engraulis encrasicolus]|uniref:toll-like receptor 13 n=1 Tax=Engraulis encrasicolus TaxID=184585 RepID=UPI002FD203E5